MINEKHFISSKFVLSYKIATIINVLKMIKILSVVGARPNFMKIAPFIREIERYNANKPNSIKHILVHTGQHYDIRMSASFFKSLNIPDPDINLEIGSGSHAEQIGHTMIAFEKVLTDIKPDWVVVVGDVNATLACSVIAKRHNIKVCHIESGLRSGDMSMPEEINRLVTDRLSDLLLTPDRISSENLAGEGISSNKIKFAGNIMIDTLESNREIAKDIEINDIIRNNRVQDSTENYLNGKDERYALMTLHRPSNVDSQQVLTSIFEFLINEVTSKIPIIWTIHPRTCQKLKTFNLWDKALKDSSLVLLEPLDYHSMLRLNIGAKLVLTDSGGLQEECCVLGTPCLTLRCNTERPVTLREHGGVSVLVGNNIDRIRQEFLKTLTLERKPSRPELWDGHTAGRVLKAIIEY
jgi:UDP-N-acetylglucosamine 2-epimerase (non-hydrolysing)